MAPTVWLDDGIPFGPTPFQRTVLEVTTVASDRGGSNLGVFPRGPELLSSRKINYNHRPTQLFCWFGRFPVSFLCS
jgi:hypothetical protein